MATDDRLLCRITNGENKELWWNLIYLSLEDGMKATKIIFDKEQEKEMSIRTLKTVKSTMPVRSTKKTRIWYWEINCKEVSNHAEQ